ESLLAEGPPPRFSGHEGGPSQYVPRKWHMTKTYSINYNLSNPGRNYQGLINMIKSLPGTWAHPGGSHWFVSTHLSGVEIRSRLKSVMDSNDQLYIHTVGDD